MTDSPQRPAGGDESGAGSNKGWTAVSYLIGGMLVWGFVGWLVDRWLHTGGVATGIGIVVGGAGGVYLVVRRMGSETEGKR